MKKVTIGLVLILAVAFSVDFIIGDRAHSWQSISQENLIPGQYLVFLEKRENSKALVKAFAKKRNLEIADDQIFLDGNPGFVARLDPEQIKALKGLLYWTRLFTKVKKIRPDFGIQSTRARMQSEPIPQSTRARMQADYSETDQTSSGVVFVGGPVFQAASGRKVWVIDSGIDSSHPDLIAQVLTGGNLARSFVPGSSPFTDENGHGTFCAGLIGARSTDPRDNLVRMNGVAAGAKLVPVKVLNAAGEGSWGNVLLGLYHALSKSTRGDVISLSLGGDNEEACDFFNGNWFNQFKKAVEDKGVFVVMSAGNIGETQNPQQVASSRINFPGCITGANFITAGSITVTSAGVEFSDFSYTGMPSIDFVTPGDMIFSTTKGQAYQLRSGTSASAAIVSGIIFAKQGLPASGGTVRGIAPDQTVYPIGKVN